MFISGKGQNLLILRQHWDISSPLADISFHLPGQFYFRLIVLVQSSFHTTLASLFEMELEMNSLDWNVNELEHECHTLMSMFKVLRMYKFEPDSIWKFSDIVGSLVKPAEAGEKKSCCLVGGLCLALLGTGLLWVQGNSNSVKVRGVKEGAAPLCAQCVEFVFLPMYLEIVNMNCWYFWGCCSPLLRWWALLSFARQWVALGPGQL